MWKVVIFIRKVVLFIRGYLQGSENGRVVTIGFIPFVFEDYTSQTHWKVQCLKLTWCGYIFYSIVSINDNCCIPVHHIIIHRLRGSDLVSFCGTIIWTEVDVVICWWIVRGVTAGISNDIPSSIIPVMSKWVSEWVSYCLTTNNDKWAIGVLDTTLCDKVCQWLAAHQ